MTRVPYLAARRILYFGLIVVTLLAGSWMMLRIVGAGGVSALEVVILALFVPTFAWISAAFWTACLGFALRVLDLNPLTLEPAASLPRYGRRRQHIWLDEDEGSATLASRTALVMLAHNEDPQRVMSALGATLGSLSSEGANDAFDVFLLSDTSEPGVARAEEEAWERLRSGAEHPERLRYRRRPRNTARKVGNLGDFCDRWGDDYDFMVVLDADSIMSGEAILELVEILESDPGAGLVQTVPLPARQASLFGRLLQFGAHLQSPLLAAGQSFWQGDAANYWGHNAALRIEAFRRHCALPVLPGGPPLGGEILSHDFVEAALLRRAGWRVYLASWIHGSYEQVPETVPDYARRDRRWAQGSLQHLRLLLTPGLHPLSRLHFLMGAMGYLASGLWLLLLVAGTAYVALAESGVAAALSVEPLFSIASLEAGSRGQVVSLLAVTVGVLFLPKGLGLIVGLIGSPRSFGGALRLVASAALEALFAVVIAPVMMLYHAGFIGEILGGRSVAWDGGKPDARAAGWGVALRETAGFTLVGVAWGALTLSISLAFFLWLSPIFLGLVAAAPLFRWCESEALGRRSRRAGLFLVPSEMDPSHVVRGGGTLRPARVTERRPMVNRPVAVQETES